jgi:hypothetical protein
MEPPCVTSTGAPRNVAFQVCLYPLLAVCLVAGWQAATVHVNYRGNWTALFCTGSRFPVPPELAEEHIYVIPDSAGFDGQFYHLIAHDPVFRQGFDRYIDAPEYRYRRILVPLLAFALAGGQSRWIDAAYIIVCWLFVGLGTFWACQFARARQRPLWLGLLFVFLPAVLASIDRLVVDVALAALIIGFAVYASGSPSWKLYLILAASALVRDTGFFLVAAYCLSFIFGRRWKSAAIFATSAIPALAWYAFVHTKTETFHPTVLLSSAPFWSLFEVVLHPAIPSTTGLPSRWLACVAGVLVLTGMLGALVLPLLAVGREKGPLQILAVLFVFLCVLLGLRGPSDLYAHVYNYGRIFTPLLLVLALRAVESGRVLPGLPLICVVPQTVMQLGTQILGIARYVLGV